MNVVGYWQSEKKFMRINSVQTKIRITTFHFFLLYTLDEFCARKIFYVQLIYETTPPKRPKKNIPNQKEQHTEENTSYMAVVNAEEENRRQERTDMMYNYLNTFAFSGQSLTNSQKWMRKKTLAHTFIWKNKPLVKCLLAAFMNRSYIKNLKLLNL